MPIMRNTKLWLLLLFGIYALAVAERFKTFRKYTYLYTAEGRNGVVGTANLRNGPKVSCKVELEVPQTCSFVLHTSECSLSEVSVIDSQGKAVYKQTAGSLAFQAAMERNPLMFVVEAGSQVTLFPAKDEPKNILNIKRGMISALMVPVSDSEYSKNMPTIHGKCRTELTVNSRKDTDTDVTVVRDLSECSHFTPLKQTSSPLALIPGLNGPLSKLIKSNQECNYQFDNRRKHMTAVLCTEKHIFLPFSHQYYGFSSIVTQSLSLQDSTKIINRYFDELKSDLHLEDAENKHLVQSKDGMLSTMRDLAGLPNTDQGEQRASLFYKLVSEIRGLKNETLTSALREMLQMSISITFESLAQCGTPECFSAIMELLRRPLSSDLPTSAIIYGLGLLSESCPLRVRDILTTAQRSQDKLVMYGLAYATKTLHKDSPVLNEVSEFMQFLLGDCTGDQEKIFMALRAIGVMGQGMQKRLQLALLTCVAQPAASVSVQKAAIEAFRLMEINPAVRNGLLHIFQNKEAPVQPRLAAYLMIMRSPGLDIESVVSIYRREENIEVQSFVASHMANILTSRDPALEETKISLKDIFGDEMPVPLKNSRNYNTELFKMATMQSNMIFDPLNKIPKEFSLKSTLKAMGFNKDIFEFGLESEGTGPASEALFGDKGFFTELLSKLVSRNSPRDILQGLSQTFNKLAQDLHSQNSPEVMTYLRLLEQELGYITFKDIKQFSNDFLLHLMQIVGSLWSTNEKELFGHYIFLDQNFNLPTAAGFPLRVSLSGLITAGGKSSRVNQWSVTPSLGVEFISNMGIHIPEFIASGTEMHTSIYHECSHNFKVTMNDRQLKIAVAVPRGNVQLFSISNKVLSVSSTHTKMVPPLVKDRIDYTECRQFFAGVNLCTVIRYSNGSSTDAAPYYPLTGETRFALELQPTGEVSEYVISNELLIKNEKGRKKIEGFKIDLKAEDSRASAATATFKYNEKGKVFTGDFQIPAYDIEAGLKFTASNTFMGGMKIQEIHVDVMNKKVSQLSLIGRLKQTKDDNAIVQAEMTIPSIKMDATASANVIIASGTTFTLETALNAPETSSLQKIIIRHSMDKNRFEVEMKSDFNIEIKKLMPNIGDMHRDLQDLIDNMLDQKVAKTDMKLRHIVSKTFEAMNIWLDKMSASIPYNGIRRNKRSIPELTLPSVPDKLYLNYDNFFRYEFNKEKFTISVHLPLSGTSSTDLHLPTMLTIPQINLPAVGLKLQRRDWHIPQFTVPSSIDLVLPQFGLAELTGKVNSNFYNWEGSLSGGNGAARYEITAESPLTLLSYKAEGTGVATGTFDDTSKIVVNCSLSHALLDISFSYAETFNKVEKVESTTNYRLRASSPLGLHASVYSSIQLNAFEYQLQGNENMHGDLSVGPLGGKFDHMASFRFDGKERRGVGESTLKLVSHVIQAENKITSNYNHGELIIISKTFLPDDAFKHDAEVIYKDSKLVLKSDLTIIKDLNHKIWVDVGVTNLKIESQIDDGNQQAYSLLTGSYDVNGLMLNVDGTLSLDMGRGFHKCNLNINSKGLSTSCTTSVRCSPVIFENTLIGGIDAKGATLSLLTKGTVHEHQGEVSMDGRISVNEASLNGVIKGTIFDAETLSTMKMGLNKHGLTFFNSIKGSLHEMKTESTHSLTATLWTIVFQSKTDNLICEDTSYKHDIKVNMRPFVANIRTKNNIRVNTMSLNSEGILKLEPVKVDLTGSISGIAEQDSIKHTYSISYGDLAGTVRCSTDGYLSSAHLRHKFDFEFAGLSSQTSNEVLINSEALRLEGVVRTLAMPFSLTVDAILNSNGKVHFYGKHSGQLNSKFLVKAEPLGIAHSQDFRASATHQMPSGDFCESQLENMFDGILTPNQQSAHWTFKSKLSNHAYNQDIWAFNNDAKMSLELTGILFTDFLNNDYQLAASDPNIQSDHSFENQEYELKAYLTYDKNSDSHIIALPFIENLPAGFEKLKNGIIRSLELIQQYINSLDINRLAGQFRATLDQLPNEVIDYIKKMDLGGKVNWIKNKLMSWTKDYAVSVEDLEASVENFREAFEKSLIDTATKIRDLKAKIRDYVESGTFSKIISETLMETGRKIKTFNEDNKITTTIIRILKAIEEIIMRTDMQRFQENSMVWLRKLEAEYNLKATLQEKLSELNEILENFDIMVFVRDLHDYILSADFVKYISQLKEHIPAEEIANVLESMKDVIVNWLEEYEVALKINVFYSKISQLLLKYDIEKKFDEFVENCIKLVKQYRFQETMQVLINALKNIQVEHFFDGLMEVLEVTISQLKSIDFKQCIDDLNKQIASFVKALTTFDYNKFVDEANQKLKELSNYVNDQIRAYEIPQKFEASRVFLREIQSSAWNYLERLKETRVAELLKMIKDVIDRTAYQDIKLKVQDILEDLSYRINEMDIKDEILYYLQKASESYTNMVDYISVQFSRLIEEIRKVSNDQEALIQLSHAVDGALVAIKEMTIEISSFTFPLTDLVIPSVHISLQNLQDISISPHFTIPAFKILNSIDIHSITIDFEDLKQMLIKFLNKIHAIELPDLDVEAIFGDIRVLYMPHLPDLTFPEITLSEIKFPHIVIPKLNYENFEITALPIPEIRLLQIPSEFHLPSFGKLSGEFKLKSPHCSVVTGASLENSTRTSKNPQFKVLMISQANCSSDLLSYYLDATLLLEAPRMKKMVLKETINVRHTAVLVEHRGSLILSGPSAEATAQTTAKFTTEICTADLMNNFRLSLGNGISASSVTSYNHNLNIPSLDISGQVTLTHNSEAHFESGTISLTAGSIGSGKLLIQDYADEGTHKSDVAFTINAATAKLTFNGESQSRSVKIKHALNAESVVLWHVTFDARAETETPFLKNSIMLLNGKAQTEDLKAELKFSHKAELIGRGSGDISNTLEFVARPFEVMFDCKNKVNSKIILPLKLTGKADLQNDYRILLNSETQHASWFGLARFNQYKYSHNFTLDNNNNDIGTYVSMNGVANLDFLTVPLSVPELSMPYLDVKTPMIKRFSLWDGLGLKMLLNTPQQSFDLNFKLKYHKNSDRHAIDIALEPIYRMINSYDDIIRNYFDIGRDQILDTLKESYNKARTQYQKYKIDTSSQPPRFFTIPGYTLPILNIEVSSFRAELPAFSYVIPKEVSTPSFKVPLIAFSIPSYTLVLPFLELPVLYVPDTLKQLTLPSFRLPETQNNVLIPALGNMTFELSFKCPVVTFNANGGLYNQSDIVAKCAVVSTSVFNLLKGKLDYTTSMTKKRGLKLATSLTFEHTNLKGSHNSTVSLIRRVLEATLSNLAEIKLPVLDVELNQDLHVHSWNRPGLASKLMGTYRFDIPHINAVGSGDIDQKTEIRVHPAFFFDSVTKGKLDGRVTLIRHFEGSLNSEAGLSLNVNGLRSLFNTQINSKFDQKRVFYWDAEVALEASPSRLYATINCTNINEASIAFFKTNSKYFAEATLKFFPLPTLLADIDLELSQPNSINNASIVQNLHLAMTLGKHMLRWHGRESIASVVHAFDLHLLNNETEVLMEMSQSLKGHLAFLKSIKLPVYQKNLWDVFKFDQASMDECQFINVSTVVVYTKSGFVLALPTEIFENGILIHFPAINVPSWGKDISRDIKNIDHVSLTPVFTIPPFTVPLTTLQVPAIQIDPQNIKIPKLVRVPTFHIGLPGLPHLTVPEVDIDTQYFKDKMSHLLVKLPVYEIIISDFSFPKTLYIGSYVINLDDITTRILKYELPAFKVPEQTIVIPEISFRIPMSLFIPTFGAISTTTEVSSSIYNMTWTTELENKMPEFAAYLKSSCNSSMDLFTYDADARAIVRFENGAFSVNGKGVISHSDLNIDWNHVFAQHLRVKRQDSQDSSSSQHTLSVDITSPSFIDVSARYASHKNGITSSVSSPSAGFIGFQLQRKSPSQYYGKIFSRYPSSPDKDTDILVFKTNIRNADKLALQMTWSPHCLLDISDGVRERMPLITNSVKNFINKYHMAHFGIDLKTATMKLKNTVSGTIEKSFQAVPHFFDSMQNSIEEISQQTRDAYSGAVESLSGVGLMELRSTFSTWAGELLALYETNLKPLLDAIMKFFRETKFQVPGMTEKISVQELYDKIRHSVSQIVTFTVQKLISMMDQTVDAISSYVRDMAFTLPFSNKVIQGKEVVKKIKSAMKPIKENIALALRKLETFQFKNLFLSMSDLLNSVITNIEETLEAEHIFEDFSLYRNASRMPMVKEFRAQITNAKRNVAEYKTIAKLKVQEVYNDLSVDMINEGMAHAAEEIGSEACHLVNRFLELMRSVSQKTEPYMKISNKKVDIEIPLPFFWKSFSEWPKITRQ
uniref:Vitellogenin domain-containing protein n=1 Tax=Denticeps clupeoides TaxID=299321 RepID=A0AAY4AYW0_9TELE